MGKAQRLKAELEEVSSLHEILTVLKDVSTNRFLIFNGQRFSFQKYYDAFVRFFDLLKGDTALQSPLLRDTRPGVDILVIASELGFMSQLNSRVSSITHDEYKKYPDARLICLGPKGSDKCRGMGMRIEKSFNVTPIGDRYKLAIDLRDYLMERIQNGTTGKVIVCYAWAKNLGVMKANALPLLPIDFFMATYQRPKESAPPAPAGKFIMESDVQSLVLSLAKMWSHVRIYEILIELQIVEAAAQAQQLESAIESLAGEKKKVLLNFRKASREQLNAAMRGVITSTNMTKAKARAKAAAA